MHGLMRVQWVCCHSGHRLVTLSHPPFGALESLPFDNVFAGLNRGWLCGGNTTNESTLKARKRKNKPSGIMRITIHQSASETTVTTDVNVITWFIVNCMCNGRFTSIVFCVYNIVKKKTFSKTVKATNEIPGKAWNESSKRCSVQWNHTIDEKKNNDVGKKRKQTCQRRMFLQMWQVWWTFSGSFLMHDDHKEPRCNTQSDMPLSHTTQAILAQGCNGCWVFSVGQNHLIRIPNVTQEHVQHRLSIGSMTMNTKHEQQIDSKNKRW